MFEQSTISTQKHPGSQLLSLFLQSGLIGTLLLANAFRVEELKIPMRPPMLPPLSKTRIVTIHTGPAAHRPVVHGSRTLFLPSHPPSKLSTTSGVSMVEVGLDSVLDTSAVGPWSADRAADAVISSLIPSAAPPQPPAPPPVPAKQTPPVLRVSLGALEAKLVHKVMPTYPRLAVTMQVQGTVLLQAVVGRDGSVQSLEASSGHPLLVKAAIDAVKQWRYKPAVLNGEPAEIRAPIQVNFTLSR